MSIFSIISNAKAKFREVQYNREKHRIILETKQLEEEHKRMEELGQEASKQLELRKKIISQKEIINENKELQPNYMKSFAFGASKVMNKLREQRKEHQNSMFRSNITKKQGNNESI